MRSMCHDVGVYEVRLSEPDALLYHLEMAEHM